MLTCCGALGKDKIKVCKAFTVYVNLSAASDNALRIKAICAAHLCKSSKFKGVSAGSELF